jgi:hypothetical protein
MDKLTSWRRNYDQLILESNTAPFVWGEHDCVMFAAKAIDAQYELGVVAYIKANLAYSNEGEAIDIIEEHGDLEGLVTEVLGVGAIPPALLTVGDVVLYEYGIPGFQHALAVHDGHQILSPAKVGLTYLHMTRALKGWRL